MHLYLILKAFDFLTVFGIGIVRGALRDKVRIIAAFLPFQASDVKEQAESILSALGIPASNAINMFYKQIILNRGLPYNPCEYLQMPVLHVWLCLLPCPHILSPILHLIKSRGTAEG